MSETAEIETIEALLAQKLTLPTEWASSKRSEIYHTIASVSCEQHYGKQKQVWRARCGKNLEEREMLVTGIIGTAAKLKRSHCRECGYAMMASVRHAIETAEREIRHHRIHNEQCASYQEALDVLAQFTEQVREPDVLAPQVLGAQISRNPADDSKPGGYKVTVDFFNIEQVELRAEDEHLKRPEAKYWTVKIYR